MDPISPSLPRYPPPGKRYDNKCCSPVIFNTPLNVKTYYMSLYYVEYLNTKNIHTKDYTKYASAWRDHLFSNTRDRQNDAAESAEYLAYDDNANCTGGRKTSMSCNDKAHTARGAHRWQRLFFCALRPYTTYNGFFDCP